MQVQYFLFKIVSFGRPVFFFRFFFFEIFLMSCFSLLINLPGGLSGCGLACHSEWHAQQAGEPELFFLERTPNGPTAKDADSWKVD